MEFIPLELPGLILVKPRVFADGRGHFFEWYKKELFAQNGITADFVQTNHSRSKKGVVRGLHFQRPPRAQDKLVRVVRGAALDVVVDLRKGSPTYGKWTSVELSDTNNHALFVPKGFAHGFAALTDDVDFEYQVSDTWAPETEGGIHWNDPDLGITWGVDNAIVNGKDDALPRLKDIGEIFRYDG